MVPSPIPVADVDVHGADSADTDALLRALAEPRRRYALSALADHEEPLALEALASRVVAMECDCDETETAEVVERNVLVALYHTHAPLLAEADLVDFDRDERTVSLTGLGREVQPVET